MLAMSISIQDSSLRYFSVLWRGHPWIGGELIYFYLGLHIRRLGQFWGGGGGLKILIFNILGVGVQKKNIFFGMKIFVDIVCGQR